MEYKPIYIRKILAYADYFKDFKRTLQHDTLVKLYRIFTHIMTVEHISSEFLKKIRVVDDLNEIRMEDGGNAYRIFCCFDDGNLVILFNAFRKKTQKTPTDEIQKAKRIMNEYFNDKKEKI